MRSLLLLFPFAVVLVVVVPVPYRHQLDHLPGENNWWQRPCDGIGVGLVSYALKVVYCRIMAFCFLLGR